MTKPIFKLKNSHLSSSSKVQSDASSVAEVEEEFSIPKRRSLIEILSNPHLLGDDGYLIVRLNSVSSQNSIVA